MVINLPTDSLPSYAIGTLYKSKILGFCSSLKSSSIQLNVATGAYMQDKSLFAAYPKELRRTKSIEVVKPEAIKR